jgi:hypothetical protein
MANDKAIHGVLANASRTHTVHSGGQVTARRSPNERDIVIRDHGSIVMLHALTPAAHSWLVDHTQEDAQWFGEALAVEPRYVADIVNGAADDGLVVRHGYGRR